MLSPDLINGLFESAGGFFIALSVFKLHREKIVRGVSWAHVTFFTSWGFWNLFFYPHLDQWFSFWGGVALVAVNVVWLAQIAYYLRREHRAARRVAHFVTPELRLAFPHLREGAPMEQTERFRWRDK